MRIAAYPLVAIEATAFEQADAVLASSRSSHVAGHSRRQDLGKDWLTLARDLGRFIRGDTRLRPLCSERSTTARVRSPRDESHEGAPENVPDALSPRVVPTGRGRSDFGWMVRSGC